MRYHVLATDYDGTLAHHGHVGDETIEALDRVKRSGRKLLLVTGRELNDLCAVFPYLDLFDRAVLENGAVLYQPATRETRVLAEPPPATFAEALRARGVHPVSTGRVIVATWEPHEVTTLDLIHEQGLELQVIFNKGAVMVLPTGINKATGLRAALEELGLSLHNAVGIGDAENDHAFLSACECGVAVANALSTLKERADIVMAADHGAGVRELVEHLLTSDLSLFEDRLTRHELSVGERENGAELRVPVYGGAMLVAGTSGAGKSTMAMSLLERLAECGYQFCIVDPEGDYAGIEIATVLGDSTSAPRVAEIIELLNKPDRSVVINLLALPMADRPAFFDSLLLRLQEMRAIVGRPHWLVLDEAHHLLPQHWQATALALPREFHSVLLITVHPDRVSPAILGLVSSVVAIGADPSETFNAFARAVGTPAPRVPAESLPVGQALCWVRSSHSEPVRFTVRLPRAERRRHVRKYASGELGPDKSFYFRGPEAKLNLRAQNLQTFLQIADGVDDETWLYHLRRGDVSRWYREAIKDPALADETERIEANTGLSPLSSKTSIREAIARRYAV